MGSDAVPHARMVDKDTCSVDLVGNSLGMLIGRRGETLDAIQQLFVDHAQAAMDSLAQ